jgi:hypothetical protein
VNQAKIKVRDARRAGAIPVDPGQNAGNEEPLMDTNLHLSEADGNQANQPDQGGYDCHGHRHFTVLHFCH